MAPEQGIRARLIRTFGFVRKELSGVLRQPRLLLTLVLGPFLILVVFGLGYRNSPPPFETLLVLSGEQARLATDIEDLSESFGDSIALAGTTTDAESAEGRLQAGEVDLLIIAPEDPLASLDAGESADFTVVHGEVDPVIRASINLLARLSVDEINRRVLANVVTTAQDESQEVEDPLSGLRQGAGRMVDALERGDRATADEEVAALQEGLATAEGETAAANDLYSSIAESLGTSHERVFSSLEDLLEGAQSGDQDEALDNAREMEEALAALDAQLDRAQELDPGLLVSPFGAEVIQVTDVPQEAAVFYGPGTLVLLVQHLALTFGALSLVRERELGLSEVFRVSPLSPWEATTGKYLGFTAISAVVAAVLTVTLLLFGVPMRGSAWLYAAIVGLLIWSSLGLGFVISAASRSDNQAVQYSMMVLLVSIFFTGFVLPLEQLAPPVQVISYLLPGTYGISALHDIMFRGAQVDSLIIGGLALYALVLGSAAWWSVRRDVASLRP